MNAPHFPDGASLRASPPAVAMRVIWQAIRTADPVPDCPFCSLYSACVGRVTYAVDSALRSLGVLKGIQYHVPLGAFTLIAQERARAIVDEGFDPTYDAEHDAGALARAAACYLTEAVRQMKALAASAPSASVEPPSDWPWGALWWKPGDGTDPERLLVKAGQLLVAELDRHASTTMATCPRCGRTRRHPVASAHEGEVTVCPDSWHTRPS